MPIATTQPTLDTTEPTLASTEPPLDTAEPTFPATWPPITESCADRGGTCSHGGTCVSAPDGSSCYCVDGSRGLDDCPEPSMNWIFLDTYISIMFLM